MIEREETGKREEWERKKIEKAERIENERNSGQS